jgi:putative GTP pyrophosphokinase
MAKVRKRIDDRKWLGAVLPRHERVTRAVSSLLENMLRENNIEFLSINGRTKTLEGALEKIQRKKYRDPKKQLTDLSGIRVITYLESQVSEISSTIQKLFEVDDQNSLDRSQVLGSDRMGYRSAHFVCCLGKSREGLPEYDTLCDLKFEIQVRTVLQHAWAELAHDRSFKFGPGLPTHIQRKLNLYSGMLEIVDAAFDNIATEIDEYAASINKKSLEEIKEVEVSNITLNRYIDSVEERIKAKIHRMPIGSDVIAELQFFGLKTIGDLEAITSPSLIKLYKDRKPDETSIGFIRSVMMFHDLKKYLSGPVSWSALGKEDVALLATKYDRKELEKALEDHHIRIGI